jgi:regulatory protein
MAMGRQNEFAGPDLDAAAGPRAKELRPARRRGASKGLSEDRLNKAALYYLGRYAASTDSVRRVLGRRVAKYAAGDGVDVETARGWIDAIIERLTRAGLLDDGNFADGRARTLFDRGLSVRMIRVKLSEKGLDRAVVEQAIDKLMENHRDPDLIAARRFVQRRRLGPYRPETKRELNRNKDLGAMARAGFAFDIARLVIEAGSVDALDGLDRGR